MRLVRCPFISSFIATSSGTERVSAPNLQKAVGALAVPLRPSGTLINMDGRERSTSACCYLIWPRQAFDGA